MSLADYRRLWELARKRTSSGMDYLEFQKFQATLLIRYLKGRGLTLKGKRVLDLGCGFAGYSLAFAEDGGRVTALDLGVPEQMGDGPPVEFVQEDALSMPFGDASFDFVFCASLIEHVPEPEVLMAGIYRVLDQDGDCYLSFPPFYTPIGGHQFSPFHLLGEALALRIFRWRASRGKAFPESTPIRLNPASFAASCRDWGLYPLTIGRARRITERVGFEVVDTSTRHCPINFARLPFLSEFLTWHVQFILKKR